MLGGTVMEKIESSNNTEMLNPFLLHALNKGIDDFENERTVPHEQAIEMVHRRLKEHVRNIRNSGGH